MKKVYRFIVIASFVCGTSPAGYWTIKAGNEDTARNDLSRNIKQWSGSLIRADGSLVELIPVGDRFGSVELFPGETCHICLIGDSFKRGLSASISSTHGGTIRGQSRAEVPVGNGGELCFDYTIGELGEHPVQVRIGGQKATLTLVARKPPAAK